MVKHRWVLVQMDFVASPLPHLPNQHGTAPDGLCGPMYEGNPPGGAALRGPAGPGRGGGEGAGRGPLRAPGVSGPGVGSRGMLFGGKMMFP